MNKTNNKRHGGMRMSLRRSDTAAEIEIGKFLDRYFYPRFNNGENKVIRIFDRALQLKGIDVIFEKTSGNKYFLDEKAQVHYINKNLPTFAFEIDSIQRGNLTPGWFLNQHYETTHYVLIWINANKEYDEKKVLTCDSIEFLDVMIVDRKKLITNLNSIISIQNIQNISHFLRSNNVFGKGEKIASIGHWYYTEYLEEKPINIVLYKCFLIDICERHYIVDKNELKTLKGRK